MYWLSKGLQKGDYLRWLGLIKATKKLLGTNDNLNIETKPTIVCTIRVGKKEIGIHDVQTKEVYASLICDEAFASIDVKPRAARYIPGAETVNWQETFSLIKNNTVYTKSKEFQFMFLHDILPTKYWLHKWKIEDNDRCTFCNSHTETLGHLFWDCVPVQALWLGIETWVREVTDTNVSINETSVFLGCKSALIHTLILTIFQAKCKNEYPNMNVYHATVQSVMKTEIYIAGRTSNHRLMKLLEKWEAVRRNLP
jgi:hypothetical protein